MSVFSYVFLWSRSTAPWPAPTDLLPALTTVGLNLTAIALAWLANRTLKRPPLATLLMVLAGVAVAAAWGLDLSGWREAGLKASMSAQGAIVYAMHSWQGFFVGVCGLMALYVVLRWLFGYVGPDRPATMQLVGLFLDYVAAQGLVLLCLPRLLALAAP